MSSYTVSEAEEEVEVCLRVVSGQLGTDITLQLETISGTAVGEQVVTILCCGWSYTALIAWQYTCIRTCLFYI